MCEILIQQSTFQDIPAMVLIENECFSEPWSEKGFQSAFKDGISYFISAKANKILVGYAGMYNVLDEGYVYNLAVSEKFRGNKIGKKLIKNLLDYSKNKNLSFLSLEVRKSNQIAIDLYEKTGFEIIGTRKDFYNFPKEDGIIMTNYLQNKRL